MPKHFRFREKLVIVSHVVHYRCGGQLYAYAPYAREIEIWAGMFDEILIAAPCREQEPPGDCARFNCENLRVIPQREIGGETWAAKAKLALALPMLTWDLCRAMSQGDAIHVRCPGNLGLLGSILAPLFSNHLVAKYAGQWGANQHDGFTARLQRAVLRSRWWRGPVTVYGHWPNEPANIVPFFSSALTDAQLARAGATAETRSPAELRHVLFVGRLSRAKNVHILLNALSRLRAEGVFCTATVAGEGPELAVLKRLSQDLGLSDSVEFAGGISSDRVIDLLTRSGILVLASQTEGWPKAIVEAMAFGLVVVGSDVGLIPKILGENRGLMVPPRDVDALATALRKVLSAPEEYSAMRARASAWGRRYSIESLRDSLDSLLVERWGLPPGTPKHEPVVSVAMPVQEVNQRIYARHE
jgi:glycosyltransferase involved in cell wall biosynthesis